MPKNIVTKFPETIYVKQELDDDGTYMVASDDPDDLVEQGVAVPAAEYVLKQAGVVIETKTVVTRK